MYTELDYKILNVIKEGILHLEKSENMMINNLVYYHTLESIPLKTYSLMISLDTIKGYEELEKAIMDTWKR